MTKPIAPYSNASGTTGIALDIRGARGAWHVWQNTQGRFICNGPSMESRHLDCPDIDSAISCVWQCGAHDVARALQQVKREAMA